MSFNFDSPTTFVVLINQGAGGQLSTMRARHKVILRRDLLRGGGVSGRVNNMPSTGLATYSGTEISSIQSIMGHTTGAVLGQAQIKSAVIHQSIHSFPCSLTHSLTHPLIQWPGYSQGTFKIHLGSFSLGNQPLR